MIKKISILMLVLSTLYSCHRYGCSDTRAENFDAEVTKDDGTCQFSTYVSFYKGKNMAKTIVDGGGATVSLYINGHFVGSETATVYFDTPPECKNPQLINTIVSLENEPSKQFLVRVEDNNGKTYLNRSVTFHADECAVIELL